MIVVIAGGAVAIDFALRSLLIDQSRLSIAQTGEQIQRTATAATAQTPTDLPLALILSNPATIDHWASANQYVEIDTVDGRILGKSSDLGSYAFPALQARGSGGSFRILRDAGDPPATMLVLTRTIVDAAGRPAAIADVAARLDIVSELMRRAREILLAVAVAAVAVIVGASFFIAGLATDPIARLTAAISEIGSERLDLRLHWARRDELGRLARAFDAMLDRLQSAFARERQFITDASHELRTPLTVINANAQLLQRWGDRDPQVRADSIEAIAAESGRLGAMVSGMLILAKAEAGDAIPREPLVLERLVDEVVAGARERAAAKGLALRARHPAGAATIVVGEPGLLRQLVANLIDNAVKFTPAGWVEASVRHDGGWAVLEVADTGAGIAGTSAERLFDRFFRGDPAHARAVEGTGLGLAIVRSIARVHGGTVTASARPDGGSVFTVRLPAEPESLTGDQ